MGTGSLLCMKARFLWRAAAVVAAAALLPWGGLLAAMDAAGESCALHGADCGCRKMCRRKAERPEPQREAPACHRKSEAETPRKPPQCAANRCESGEDVSLWDPERRYLTARRFSTAPATDSAPLRGAAAGGKRAEQRGRP